PCDDGVEETEFDTWTADCQCVGTPTGDCTELVTIELQTDDDGDQTSWEILAQGTMTEMCSGAGFPDNAVVTNTCCLPEGCYILRVLDNAGDGMANGTDGGYILRTFPTTSASSTTATTSPAVVLAPSAAIKASACRSARIA